MTWLECALVGAAFGVMSQWLEWGWWAVPVAAACGILTGAIVAVVRRLLP